MAYVLFVLWGWKEILNIPHDRKEVRTCVWCGVVIGGLDMCLGFQ